MQEFLWGLSPPKLSTISTRGVPPPEPPINHPCSRVTLLEGLPYLLVKWLLSILDMSLIPKWLLFYSCSNFIWQQGQYQQWWYYGHGDHWRSSRHFERKLRKSLTIFCFSTWCLRAVFRSISHFVRFIRQALPSRAVLCRFWFARIDTIVLSRGGSRPKIWPTYNGGGVRRLYRRRKTLGAWGRFEMWGDCWGAFPLAKTIGSFGGEAPLICSFL